MKKYELIPHTADIGIRVRGKNPGELFQNAAFALFDIMTDINEIRHSLSEQITLGVDNYEELMNYWLSNLLQQFTIYNRLFSQFDITAITENSLAANIQGEPYDQNRHEIHNEIKAVTFHNLTVKQIDNEWVSEVIFDV